MAVDPSVFCETFQRCLRLLNFLGFPRSPWVDSAASAILHNHECFLYDPKLTPHFSSQQVHKDFVYLKRGLTFSLSFSLSPPFLPLSLSSLTRRKQRGPLSQRQKPPFSSKRSQLSLVVTWEDECVEGGRAKKRMRTSGRFSCVSLFH